MIFIHIYLRCCKIPKEYGSNSSSISNYVNIFEITSTQHYTNLLRIGSQLRKCEETRDWKQQAHQLCRFNAEKSTCGKLIDISSILKVKSTLKFPRPVDVIISTWICLSKSIKFQWIFRVEFLQQNRWRIDEEYVHWEKAALILT